jgi:PilZ domain/GYF domain 2
MYYVVRHTKHLGPYSESDVLRMLQSRELNWLDQVYWTEELLEPSDQAPETMTLAKHKTFQHVFIRTYLPEKVQLSLSEPEILPPIKEWYVLKEEKKFGPYRYSDLVQFLQQKQVAPFDWVWNASFQMWKPIQDCVEFHPEMIRTIKEWNEPELQTLFSKRRHLRLNYQTQLTIHSDKNYWNGRSLEISAGGAGILVPSSELKSGQRLFLHFKAGMDIPAFNALCEVVSKQVPKVGVNEFRYGLQFTHVTKNVRKAIEMAGQKLVA